MKHRAISLCLALTTLALVSVAAPGQAQQTPQDMVPLKAVVKGTFPQAFVMPGNPPIMAFNYTWPGGQSDLLGPFIWWESSHAVLGAEGAPLAEPNGMGALTAENGDAIFLRYTGLVHLTGTTMTCDHIFTVTGGKGRFAGATGSGAIKGEADLMKNVGSLTFDGVITRPTAKP